MKAKQSEMQESRNTGLSPESLAVRLILKIWALTADQMPEPGEAELRARTWVELFDGTLFGTPMDNMIPYVLKVACQRRAWRGPIQADEFFRYFTKIVYEQKVWSVRDQDWIDESEAIMRLIEGNPKLETEWQEASAGMKWDPFEPASSLKRCEKESEKMKDLCMKVRAHIYGWEDLG